MATNISIEGSTGAIDPLADYLSNFPQPSPPLSKHMFRTAQSLHGQALETLVKAPHMPVVKGEVSALVETRTLEYVTKKGLGHLCLQSDVSLPSSDATDKQIFEHAAKEESPVAIIFGSGSSRRASDIELFTLAPDGLFRWFMETGEQSHLVNGSEVNYLGALIRKMRKAWDIKAKDDKSV